ncbi:hypothetical protein AVEN_262166-1 [Araneus ventricosus]|uniref:Uncharacterized protein n=1 Tax=Araneus ventricosus TaxID=182803 RepID=A0A4Y2EH06_ARAVE|nr:hypothetical protein AVEN_262166-1 [Araneus ventricosus]
MLNKKLFPHLPKRVFSPQTFFSKQRLLFLQPKQNKCAPVNQMGRSAVRKSQKALSTEVRVPVKQYWREDSLKRVFIEKVEFIRRKKKKLVYSNEQKKAALATKRCCSLSLDEGRRGLPFDLSQ